MWDYALASRRFDNAESTGHRRAPSYAGVRHEHADSAEDGMRLLREHEVVRNATERSSAAGNRQHYNTAVTHALRVSSPNAAASHPCRLGQTVGVPDPDSL